MPNGEYWEYGRFEPYSTLFKVAADSYENWHILSGDPAREDIFLKGLQAVSTGIGYTMVDATYMKNAMEVLTLINNAIGKKELDNFQDNTPYLKKRLAALMVPNIAEGPGAAFDSNMREIGYGDTSINKNMKFLVKNFYNILLNCENFSNGDLNSKQEFLSTYLKDNNIKKKAYNASLIRYFDKYQAFCLDLSLDSVLKGDLKFRYK